MLTTEIIDSAPGPTSSTYISRFGSLLRTYEMVGQNSPKALTRRSSQLRRSRQQRRDVLQGIKAVLKERLELIQLEDAHHATLLVDNKIRVALVCVSWDENSARTSQMGIPSQRTGDEINFYCVSV